MKIKEFDTYLGNIENAKHKEILKDLLTQIATDFPGLDTRIAWNQPMFTHHGTFIIGLSVSKKHISLSPEWKAINEFKEKIKEAGYEYGKMTIKLPWDNEVDYNLIKELIEYNIEDKKEVKTFWRK